MPLPAPLSPVSGLLGGFSATLPFRSAFRRTPPLWAGAGAAAPPAPAAPRRRSWVRGGVRRQRVASPSRSPWRRSRACSPWTTRCPARCRAFSSASTPRRRRRGLDSSAGCRTPATAPCEGRPRVPPPGCGSCRSGSGRRGAPTPASAEPSSPTRGRSRRWSTRTSGF